MKCRYAVWKFKMSKDYAKTESGCLLLKDLIGKATGYDKKLALEEKKTKKLV